MGKDWLFNEPPDLAVITTQRVLSNRFPILLVSHDDDGGWQFLDGVPSETDDVRIVSLHRIITLDPTIQDLASLPPGKQAWRENRSELWQKTDT